MGEAHDRPLARRVDQIPTVSGCRLSRPITTLGASRPMRADATCRPPRARHGKHRILEMLFIHYNHIS